MNMEPAHRGKVDNSFGNRNLADLDFIAALRTLQSVDL